jgi:CBS domain-containing protein
VKKITNTDGGRVDVRGTSPSNPWAENPFVAGKIPAATRPPFAATTAAGRHHRISGVTHGGTLLAHEIAGRAASPLVRWEAAMTAGDICTRDVAVALKTEMVVDLAKRMRTSHVGAVIIVENHLGHHRPIGIVTDRDIVVSAVAGDPDHLNYLMADDMMTIDLVTATLDESVGEALQKMQRAGVRRLPVVDSDGDLVGILTLDDLLKHLIDQQCLLVGIITREQRQERQHRV